MTLKQFTIKHLVIIAGRRKMAKERRGGQREETAEKVVELTRIKEMDEILQ